MGRKKREWYPGATYHVMSRGNRRNILFRDPSDLITFLECIEKAKDMYPFTLHSLCLMTNHFHMILETEDITLSKIMQRILHPYTMIFNTKYGLTGHLFESRYTACIIKEERYFLEVSRYIHLNPVKAHIVEKPQDYEYSSFGKFVPEVGAKKSFPKQMIEKLVETEKILGSFGGGPNRGNEYRKFVEDRLSHTDHEVMIQKEIKEDDEWLPI